MSFIVEVNIELTCEQPVSRLDDKLIIVCYEIKNK